MVNNVVVSDDEKDRELNQQTHNENENKNEFTSNIEIISNNDNSYIPVVIIILKL